MQVILDQHDQMAREFRESSEALRAQADEQAKYLREQTANLIAYVRAQSDLQADSLSAHAARMAHASAAINKATSAMIAANGAAMALWNEHDPG